MVKFLDKIQELLMKMKDEGYTGYQIAKILNTNPPQMIKVMRGEANLTLKSIKNFENIGYMPILILVPYTEEEYRKYEDLMDKTLQDVYEKLKEKAEEIRNNRRGRRKKNTETETENIDYIDTNTNNDNNENGKKEIDLFDILDNIEKEKKKEENSSTTDKGDENIISLTE